MTRDLQASSDATALLHTILDAAAAWLERIEVEAGTTVVVTVAPHTAIGLWRPGFAAVWRMRRVDEAAVKVMQAAGPIVERALKGLDAVPHEAALEAVARGARLQLLLSPAMGEAAVRLDDGRTAVELVSMTIERVAH